MEEIGHDKSSHEDWLIQLNGHLIDSLATSSFASLELDVQRKSVTQVTNGVAFLIQRKLQIVSATSTDDFDMTSANHCVLAKCTHSDFYKARHDLNLNAAEVVDFGYIHNGITTFLSEDRKINWSWYELYNFLWRTTGQFFKTHPEFGVN